jgi:hypothetical protein
MLEKNTTRQEYAAQSLTLLMDMYERLQQLSPEIEVSKDTTYVLTLSSNDATSPFQERYHF